ncbi:hypothetical protein A1F97_11020 [Pyrenophora tritici-repentis]|uniref:Uncharacterized protein n=2 Tax=Pyrenophora tritici-repentis TaxID=45151 RepID=A0A2W1D4J0_9PLEO|nr:uncharacterized protein PTRG_03136 [Pyrenophora tritici-repentis Pt-1C-BFP]KAF7575118.1 hypothetical protein PtrM4_067420 [Pyrenophora tritici-repentis]EDU45659.1 predicted protein [Pyrenophora tritici-repentis Pt-1C-BFP]KAI1515128.1 hypothetical protein Ptr86124_006451 [Pyrenophora tritici-repentis]KAI1672703.1 hypothetical protein L13192_03562 [Pyrenophora tritici-repentis]KAI1686743.1 hypothetical protein KJE20_04708 [Pyrenophora tritici-repentis]
MAPTLFPMTKLLSRKMVPIPRHHGKNQSKNITKAANMGRVKTSLTQTTSPDQELSQRELKRPLVHTNVLHNYQHPDEELIASMRKKAGLKPLKPSSLVPSCQPATGEAVPSDSRAQVAVSTTTPRKSLEDTIPGASNVPKTYAWEEKAQGIIMRDRLTLDKDWSKITWKQKSSNITRLKLLKDDGYNITPLEGKVSADQIIDALLAHIEARKQRTAPSLKSGATASIDELENEFEQPRDEGLPTSVAEDGDDGFVAISATKVVNNYILASKNSHLQNFRPQKPVRLEPQLCPKDEFYQTQEIIGTKRKHTHEDDNQPNWHEKRPQLHLHEIYAQRDTYSAEMHDASSCTCGFSPSKLMRIATPEQVEKVVKVQAFELVKWRTSRGIFSASREEHRAFRSRVIHSDERWSSAPELCVDPRKPIKPCRIVFTEHYAPATQPTGSDVYIGSVGFNYIKDEIKYLSCDRGKDRSYQIRDHEQREDEEGDTVMECFDWREEPFRHEIRLSSNDEHVAFIDGEPLALVGLLNYLTTGEMMHLGRWKYGDIKENADNNLDPEMKVIHNGSVPLNLSKATDLALKKIEGMLKAVQDAGGVEISVGVIHQNK